MARYTFSQSTAPNHDDILNAIANSAMTDKNTEGITWYESEGELYIDFANALSGGDEALLTSIISANADNPVIIPNNKYYNSKDNIVSLTSDVWTQKVRLQVNIASSETYIIGYCAQVVSGNNYDIELRVQVNDNEDIATIEIRDSKWQTFSGFVNLDLEPGSHTIDLDFRSSSFNKTVEIQNARLYAIRINE